MAGYVGLALGSENEEAVIRDHQEVKPHGLLESVPKLIMAGLRQPFGNKVGLLAFNRGEDLGSGGAVRFHTHIVSLWARMSTLNSGKMDEATPPQEQPHPLR